MTDLHDLKPQASKSTIYNCNCLQQNTLIFFAGFPITKASSTSKSNSCEKKSNYNILEITQN